MKSLMLKPMTLNLDLVPDFMAVLTFSRNVILDLSIWNFLVSNTEVIVRVGGDIPLAT